MDLINFEKSNHYNPFKYIKDEKDVIKLINNLIRNTTPKTAVQSEPFWEKSETALLQALMFYLLNEAPPEEQNFCMVMTMIEHGSASENDEQHVSPLDLLFMALETEKPNSIAVRQYAVFKQAAGKTAKSILISCAVRLAAFNLEQIRDITSDDELDVASIGSKKTALFAVIPDNDTTFNFLIGLLYTQIFKCCIMRRIISMTEDCLAMCILCSMSSPTSLCQRSLISALQQCAQGEYPLLLSYKT